MVLKFMWLVAYTQCASRHVKGFFLAKKFIHSDPGEGWPLLGFELQITQYDTPQPQYW